MRDELKKLCKKGKNDYENKDRKDWVLEHIAQCVATVAQLKWTESTEAFINEISENNNENALWDWLEGNKIQLMQLTDLINGGLTGI